MESEFHNTEFRLRGLVPVLNRAASADLARSLELCLNVPRWIAEMVQARPFADAEGVLAAVAASASPLTDDEIHDALQSHPRIGERPDGDGDHARHARADQSDVDTADIGVEQQLRDGNIAYEKRYGQVFLIRAAGRNAADILAEQQVRMHNDRATEMAVVERELRDIAALRIARVMTDVRA